MISKRKIKSKIKKKLRKIAKFVYKKIYYQKRKLTIKKICKILDVKVPKELKSIQNKEVAKVTGRLKSVTPNCVFFTSMHKPTKQTKQKLQENCLCVFSEVQIEGCKCIIIDNPRYDMLKIFNYLRNLNDLCVISVTGSVGKTSTKEMIESVLMTKYEGKMVSSVGNFNSVNSTTINIRKLKDTDKIFLQEAGLGKVVHKGKLVNDIITRIALMIEPNIAVYTNIKDSHIEWYGTREKLAEEKCKLSKYGKKDGIAIINYDDPILMKYPFEQKTISYSLDNKNADCYATNINHTKSGTSFTINDNINNNVLDISLSLIGEQHVLNALVAYIVGKQKNVSDKKIKSGIRKYKTKGMRQNLFSVGDYQILADCYNSSYDAIKNIMKTFSIIETTNGGEKIAVIGDIFELGDISEEIHKKVGELISEYDIDKVIFCGKEMKFAYNEYKKKKDNATYFKEKEGMESMIRNIVKPNDIILFKASNGMTFYRTINKIFGTEIYEQLEINEKRCEKKDTKDFDYINFYDYCLVEKYKGKNKKVVIPNTIDNIEITGLAKESFCEDKNINEIVLSSKISVIGNHAFSDSSIEKIKLDENLRIIRASAFENCKKLKEIELNNGLKVIRKYAFKNCKNLEKITIPNSVTEISRFAFENCNKIKIMCNKDSYVHKYAEKNKIDYEII